MVYRKIPVPFGKFSVKNKTSRWIVNEMPKTFNDVVYPQLPYMIRSKKANIKNPVDRTEQGQLFGLTFTVSDLFREERVVLNYWRATEARNHAERLIVEAMRHGDRHRPTMDLANYWLRENNLIHKLFKVLVPRYENYPGSFTALHRLGEDYEKHGMCYTDSLTSKWKRGKNGEVVLELRGNSLPNIIRPTLEKQGLLTNVLLDAARECRATTMRLEVNNKQ